MACSSLADQFASRDMLFWRSVGEIQPGNVHPSEYHLLYDLWALAGRADRGNDFCSAFAHRDIL